MHPIHFLYYTDQTILQITIHQCAQMSALNIMPHNKLEKHVTDAGG